MTPGGLLFEKTFSAETNNATSDNELMTIVQAFEKWRTELELIESPI